MINDPDLSVDDHDGVTSNGGSDGSVPHHGAPGRARVDSAETTTRATGTDAVEASDIGHPDGADEAVGWPGAPGRELVVSVFLPGLTMLRRSPVLGVALLMLGVLLPVVLVLWTFANRDDLIGFALDQRLLSVVALICIAVVIARAIAVIEIARRYRHQPRIKVKSAIAACAVVAIAVPALGVAYQANETRATVGEVFSSGGDEALFEPDVVEPFRPEPLDPAPDVDADPDDADPDDADPDDAGEPVTDGANGDEPGDGATDGTTDGATAVDPSAVHTTLLLGSDAGPNRWGSRTDTMMLFSVHEASGRTALVSIPRNLTRLHFPPGTPLGDKFPNGFNDLANAVFTHVVTRDELIDAYSIGGQRPEVVALAQGLGYSLDVKIDDFVLVNMQAFLDVVDAVGGVRINVPKKVLLQEFNPTRNYDLPDSIGPGMVDMDGTLAIAYVRARRGDSDYYRMERQREVLAALGSQVSTAEAVAAFPKVSDVLGDSMRTSLSAGEFSDLLDQLGDNASIGESVGLTPPLVNTGRPDYANIQSIIDAIERYVLTGEPSGYAS